MTNGVSAFQRTIDKVIEDDGLSDVFVFVDNVTTCGKTKEGDDGNLQAFHDTAKKYNITFNEQKSILSVITITLLGATPLAITTLLLII